MGLPIKSSRCIILIGIALLAVSSANADPSLRSLADQNASLVAVQRFVAMHTSALNDEQLEAETTTRRIEGDFRDLRATLETIGTINTGLGQLLLEHRASLPDERSLADDIQLRSEQIAEVSVRRLLHREEARSGIRSEQFVAAYVRELGIEPTPELRNALRELLDQRLTLLTKSLADDQVYLQKLQEVNDIKRKLVTRVGEYRGFLDQHLWWTRSAEPIRVQDLSTLPNALSALGIKALGSTTLSAELSRLFQSKVLWLSIVTAVLLLWYRGAMRRAIQATAANIGRVSQDRFMCTVRALVLTSLTSLPLPLILLTVAWLLNEIPFGLDPSHAVDPSLLRVALLLYVLSFIRWVCAPRGLAEGHLKWPSAAVRRIRSTLNKLTWALVSTALLVSVAYSQNSTDTGGIIFRTGFLAFQLTLSVFLYRLLHARHGAPEIWLRSHKSALLTRSYPVVFWFCVLAPPWLAIEALAGYGHSALAISWMYLNTLGLFALLVLVYATAHRWLLLVHRRLAYAAAVERRRTMLAQRDARSSGEVTEESTELHIDDPVIDLDELSDNTRSTVLWAAAGLGVIGLFGIWSPSFPALGFFDTIDLWHHEVTVDGETQQLPTTVADIGLAIIFLLATAVLVNRLPSVMEILLLQRSGISESDRYTVSKLFTYALIAIGALAALNAIGATWSQLQWLVAALGVGLGFGLQEIVANFVSGLIILFERPVRIGDVVTIGETSGVVTKIRIRATTIRDWDRKELLVPNKELITGRVVNWSLSDEMTRIVVNVGVAYGTDVEQAMALLRQAAEEHEHALDDPPPLLSLDELGDHALALTMRVYVSAISHRIKTATDLRKAIVSKFDEAGIAIAYPQLDVHVDTAEKPQHAEKRTRNTVRELSEASQSWNPDRRCTDRQVVVGTSDLDLRTDVR